jgi:peptide/nickel transport system permease protein
MGWAVRLIRLVVCVLLVLSLNFALPRLMPGDPLLMALGPESVSLGQKSYAELRSEYGLDGCLWVQYGRYWADLASGRLGYSFHYHRTVGSLVKEHLSCTLALLIPAVLLSTLGAAFLGTAAGWKRESAFDLGVTSLALLAYATPAFLTAMFFWISSVTGLVDTMEHPDHPARSHGIHRQHFSRWGPGSGMRYGH